MAKRFNFGADRFQKVDEDQKSLPIPYLKDALQKAEDASNTLSEEAPSVDGALSGTSSNPVQNKAITIALATKATVEDLEDLGTRLANKVEKVPGKGLSSEDYTAEEKAKLAGLDSDPYYGLRVIASEKGLAVWGNPTVAAMSLVLSEDEDDKLNGRLPYRLDCVGAAEGSYVPLPITVTEFEAGSTTGVSLWCKGLGDYRHGDLELVFYDPTNMEVLEPDVTYIREGAHRHAWKVALNASQTYEVWIRVTPSGAGRVFSLLFDDIRVSKDVPCGKWLHNPWSTGRINIVYGSMASAGYFWYYQGQFYPTTSSTGMGYQPRLYPSTFMYIRGWSATLSRLNDLRAEGESQLLYHLHRGEYPANGVQAHPGVIPGTALEFVGYTGNFYAVTRRRTDMAVIVSPDEALSFVPQVWRPDGLSYTPLAYGTDLSLLVEAD